MIPRRRPAAAAPVLALAVVLGAAGCRHLGGGTVLASPPILGQLQRSDGTPVQGVRVGVVTSSRGWNCTEFAVSTATDSAGMFKLPTTTGVSPLLGLGHQGHPFQICAGSADRLHKMFGGVMGYKRDPPTVVLSCVLAPVAEPQDSARITCDSRLEFPPP